LPDEISNVSRELLKLSSELRRLEHDLYISYDARSRVEVPKEDVVQDPLTLAGFGGV
jgi:hypothetical protein